MRANQGLAPPVLMETEAGVLRTMAGCLGFGGMPRGGSGPGSPIDLAAVLVRGLSEILDAMLGLLAGAGPDAGLHFWCSRYPAVQSASEFGSHDRAALVASEEDALPGADAAGDDVPVCVAEQQAEIERRVV